MHPLGGCGAAAQWPPLPLSPLYFTYKYKRGEHKRRGQKGEGGKIERKKKKKDPKRKKGRKNKRRKKEKTEREIGEDRGKKPSTTTDSSAAWNHRHQRAPP
jgi:hypothetical protein